MRAASEEASTCGTGLADSSMRDHESKIQRHLFNTLPDAAGNRVCVDLAHGTDRLLCHELPGIMAS